MRTSVALVTCAEHPDLCEDDRLLVPVLERRGCRAEPARWDDQGQRWRDYDAVVLRLTWDYHRRLPEFQRWLDQLEGESAFIFNRMPTVRWNINKRYLRDLELAGIPVAPTVWVPKGAAITLHDLMASLHTDALVVKPTVSASAFETWRTDRSRAGDFRVQEEHGGTAERAEVSGDLVRQAQRALAAAPEPTLYARVDGVVMDGGLIVTELELVEPRLYFGWEEGGADRFADGLLAAVSDTRHPRETP